MEIQKRGAHARVRRAVVRLAHGGWARRVLYNTRCRSKSGATAVHRLAASRPRRALHRADEGGATTVWRAGTSPSSTLGLAPEVHMDESARLFLCARCLVQVRLCSRCDRGQRYCTPSCSSVARDTAQREAGRRYQRSRVGRMAHAARSRRWRIRRQRIEPVAAQPVAAQPVAGANIVTHQGCPGGPADAPLIAWTRDRAEVSLPCDPTRSATQGVECIAGPTCRRCGAALTSWVRQGFLRHSRAVRAARHDHSP